MTQAEFRSQFICQFLATWCATHYDEFCLYGKQESLERPPVEDAEFLAEAAWKEMERVGIKP